MASFRIEVHEEIVLQLFLYAGLRTTDDIFLGIVTRGVRPLIDRHHPAIDRTELPEEVIGHLGIIEIFTIFPSKGMLRHTEVQHPPRISPQLIIARIERVAQDEVAIAIAVRRDDDILSLYD